MTRLLANSARKILGGGLVWLLLAPALFLPVQALFLPMPTLFLPAQAMAEPPDFSRYIKEGVLKRLSASEVNSAISNKRELHGVTALRQMFGTPKQRFRARLVYYGDSIFSTDKSLTWYDWVRDPKIARFALYYQPNAVMKAARAGDSIALLRYGEDDVLVIVAPKNSQQQKELFELFGVSGKLPRGGIYQTQFTNWQDGLTATTTKQLQQIGKVPVDIELWRDVASGEVSISGIVTHVKDGDGLHIADKIFDIRLFGIDAFEKKQMCRRDGAQWPCGRVAHDLLRSAALGKKIHCTNKKKEKYGRFLSICAVDGQNLNALLIEQGLAVIYRADDYAEAEKRARLAGVGLWSDKVDYINPSDWRRGARLAP